MKKFFIATLLLLFVVGTLNAIDIYPARFELESEPGSSLLNQITIRNDKSFPVKVFLSAREWESSQGSVKYKQGVSDLISYNNEPFILEPDESRIVTFNVSLPSGYKGEKSIYLYVKHIVKNSNFASQLGIPVYVMSKKGLKKKIFVTNASLEGQGDKSVFFVTVRNKGNVHFRPSIFLRIKEKSSDKYIEIEGKNVFKISSDWPVMPYETKVFTGEVKGLVLDPDKKYEAEVKVVYLYRNQVDHEEVRKVKVRI